MIDIFFCILVNSIIWIINGTVHLSLLIFLQCGAPQWSLLVYKPHEYYSLIGIRNHTYWGDIHQLSYHKSAINPMKSPFSYGFPMVFPTGGPHCRFCWPILLGLHQKPASSLLACKAIWDSSTFLESAWVTNRLSMGIYGYLWII